MLVFIVLSGFCVYPRTALNGQVLILQVMEMKIVRKSREVFYITKGFT